nr:thiamine phosphate synthase [Methanosarcina horonobensis]
MVPYSILPLKKDAGKGIGPARIREVKNAIKVPVVAIGGINKENCRSVVENGADSLLRFLQSYAVTM